MTETACASTSSQSARFNSYWPWLCALAGFALDLAAFWPGLMSFDSAYAWWQARGGETTDITSPAMIDLWHLCDALHTGPGLLFAFHLALFWSGLALIIRALDCRRLAGLSFMAMVAFAPAIWLLRAHVWTDVGLMAVLTLAAGALANAQRDGRRVWLMTVLPLLLYAVALRHNALPAVLPMAVWYVWLLMRIATPHAAAARRASLAGAHTEIRSVPASAPSWRVVGIVALMIVLGLFAGAAAINARVDRHVPLWPSLAQWDLAAVSVATGKMVLPTWMLGPGMNVAELRAAFRDWSNTPMLQNTQHGMRDPLHGFSDTELNELRRDWLAAIRDHPRAWLAHRWRLTCALFGTHARDWPRELIFVDAEFQYRDNPPVAGNTTLLHRGLMAAAEQLRSSFVLAAWPYLLIGLIALPWAWRRRREIAGSSALILMASAWLYALPQTLLAPAAELRYLGWSCLASMLAAASVLFATTTPQVKHSESV